MDREAIARAQRRRQATEALAFERERAASLEGQIHEIVAELEGPRVDDEVFGRMERTDAELARSILHPDGMAAPAEEDWLIFGDDEPEPEDEHVDPREEAELEIARLRQEIDESRRRREVLERYLDALGA